MSDQAVQQDSSATAGQQEAEYRQTAKTHTRVSSSTNSDGQIDLTMGKHNTNESSASELLQSTEKSDIPMAKEVKTRKRRGAKSNSTPPPPPRRSKRHISEKVDDEKISSNGQSQSSQANDTTTNTAKTKSRATLTKSTSPIPTSNTSTSSRSTKRKISELEETQAPPLTHDSQNQLSQKST